MDMAVQGAGFFQVTMPDGTTAYTRDGSFKADSQGRMVNSNGYALSPTITIPNWEQGLTISDDGQVSVTMPGQKTPQVLGQIQLAQFINQAGLNSLGGNLFTETAASGAPTVSNPGSDGGRENLKQLFGDV